MSRRWDDSLFAKAVRLRVANHSLHTFVLLDFLLVSYLFDWAGWFINERTENVLACLMFFSWAVMRVVFAEPVDRWTWPQLVPAVVHVVVGILFLRRTVSVRRADTTTLLWCLPSFVAGGMAMNLAPDSHLWPVHSQFLFALGALGAVLGMLALGKSFAVFPALRNVVSTGPFRLIRHPIYFCELVMLLGCCSTIGSAKHWGLFVAAVVAIAIRIIWEEKVLLESKSYEDFCQAVKYRLIPGVW